MTTDAMTTTPTAPDLRAIESVLIRSDLSALTESQRLSYYHRVCDSLGLNPLTGPFEYLKLSGRLVLYAKRDATDQLRKIHGVSIEELRGERLGELYVVTARAKNRDGRVDTSTGVVSIGPLRGEALANALMKCETKAKRRVTLSICGLGMLDETELDTMALEQPATVHAPAAPAVPSGRDAVHLPSAPNGGDSGPSDDVPMNARLIVEVGPGRSGSQATLEFNTPPGEAGTTTLQTYSKKCADLARDLCERGQPCFVELKRSSTGNYRVESLRPYDPADQREPGDEPEQAS